MSFKTVYRYRDPTKVERKANEAWKLIRIDIPMVKTVEGEWVEVEGKAEVPLNADVEDVKFALRRDKKALKEKYATDRKRIDEDEKKHLADLDAQEPTEENYDGKKSPLPEI